MRNGEITVRGVADGKATVNPTFEWSNLHNDTAFSVYLTDEEDAVVETATVSAPRYEVARYLESGKTYTLTVTGEESEFVYETTFETRNGSDSAYLSAILSFADPFGSHMVLQRGKPVVISGTTNPNGTFVPVPLARAIFGMLAPNLHTLSPFAMSDVS